MDDFFGGPASLLGLAWEIYMGGAAILLGNIPAALKKIFPSANITRLGNWNSVDSGCPWSCTYLLDPSDPLFVEIGEAFIRRQVKAYLLNDPTYISVLGASVYKAMSKGDKDAVWLMQGWLFSSDSAYWKPPQMKSPSRCWDESYHVSFVYILQSLGRVEKYQQIKEQQLNACMLKVVTLI
ncbi:alpha-N-acetylglucosaminidase isoform X4 [Fagus crenata]